MALGGSGSTTNAVTTGSATQKHNHIAGSRPFPPNIDSRGRSYHSATFQTLGNITIMVQLRNVAGSKTDLIAVGRVACSSSLAKLTLRKLTGNGFMQGHSGITGTGHTHGLMHISTAGQRITDTTADAGCRTAEGLNLGGVVMGFILEHQQPILVFSIDLCGHMDGAGVDLFALVQFRKQAPLFQDLCSDGGNIHQGLGPLGSLFFPVDLHSGCDVAIIGRLNSRIINLHLFQMGGEGGVTAMVRPVSIHYPYFGNGRITMLLVTEICLQELQIIQVHSKTQAVQKFCKTIIVHSDKAIYRSNIFGSIVFNSEGFGKLQSSFTAFHSVDHVLLDGSHILIAQVPIDHIDLGRPNHRTIALAQNLNTLSSGIRSLIKLTGQRLHAKYNIPLREFVSNVVNLRFRKHCLDSIGKEGLNNILCIIPVQNPKTLDTFDLQEVLYFPQQAVSFMGLAGLFFHIYAINHGDQPPHSYAASAR